jgi:hypothetical protein
VLRAPLSPSARLALSVAVIHAVDVSLRAGVAHGAIRCRDVLVDGPAESPSVALCGWGDAVVAPSAGPPSEAQLRHFETEPRVALTIARLADILVEIDGASDQRILGDASATLRSSPDLAGLARTREELARASERWPGEGGRVDPPGLPPLLFDAPTPRAILDGSAARLRAERSPSSMVRAAQSVLHPDVVAHIRRALDRLRRRLRGRRGPVVVGVAVAAIAVALGPAAVGGVSSTAETHPLPASTRPTAPVTGSTGSIAAGPVSGGPRTAALTLLEMRENCLAAADDGCLAAIEDPVSPIATADTGPRTGTADDLAVGPSGQAVSAGRVQRIGDWAVVDLEGLGEPTTVTLVAVADGWVLRDVTGATGRRVG